jgi:hypothetical protein
MTTKRLILFFAAIFSVSFFTQASAQQAKVILLISEQNIEGPQRAWWASEVDLSTTESKLAQNLIAAGFEVLEPSSLNKVIQQDKAFRLVDFSDELTVKLGNLSKADFVIVGKAIASSGGNVPQSSMISCFANITAKVIRVKDGKVIGYLDASGSSAHMDRITGGREALNSAAQDLADKAINVLNKGEGLK